MIVRDIYLENIKNEKNHFISSNPIEVFSKAIPIVEENIRKKLDCLTFFNSEFPDLKIFLNMKRKFRYFSELAKLKSRIYYEFSKKKYENGDIPFAMFFSLFIFDGNDDITKQTKSKCVSHWIYDGTRNIYIYVYGENISNREDFLDYFFYNFKIIVGLSFGIGKDYKTQNKTIIPFVRMNDYIDDFSYKTYKFGIEDIFAITKILKKILMITSYHKKKILKN